MRDSATSTTASTAVYQSVSRTRTESSMALPDRSTCLAARPCRNTFVFCIRGVRIDQWAKQIARPPAGMEQGLAGIGVHFPAHAIHINLDQIREGIEGFIPHVLRDFRAPHNPAGVARQNFEQRLFPRGEPPPPPRA